MSNLVSDATLDNLEIIWRMILFQIRRAASCDVMGSSDWLLKSLKWGQLCEDLSAFYLHSHQNLYIHLPHSLLNTSLRSIWRWHRIFWLVDLMPWHLPGWWLVVAVAVAAVARCDGSKIGGWHADTDSWHQHGRTTYHRHIIAEFNTHKAATVAFLRSNNTRKLLEQLWFGIITQERDFSGTLLSCYRNKWSPPTTLFLLLL